MRVRLTIDLDIPDNNALYSKQQFAENIQAEVIDFCRFHHLVSSNQFLDTSNRFANKQLAKHHLDWHDTMAFCEYGCEVIDNSTENHTDADAAFQEDTRRS